MVRVYACEPVHRVSVGAGSRLSLTTAQTAAVALCAALAGFCVAYTVAGLVTGVVTLIRGMV